MSRPLCIYHANCADGFTAAWIMNRALKGEVDFFPGVYQTPPPDVRGRQEVFFLDFSYKRPVMEKILDMVNEVIVIDHHKTAIEDLKGCGVVEQFDTEHSGAWLAWNFFVDCDAPPKLVQYVQDRDLWKFELPYSREVNAWIFSFDYTFENWDRMHQQMEADLYTSVVAEGGAIERKHHKDVAELVKVTRRMMYIGGHLTAVANVPYTLTSDAGHLMASGYDCGKSFAACYWDTPKGRVFSLRSTETGPDVSEIAKQYGGGGHKHAAGFTVPFDQLAEKGLL